MLPPPTNPLMMITHRTRAGYLKRTKDEELINTQIKLLKEFRPYVKSLLPKDCRQCEKCKARAKLEQERKFQEILAKVEVDKQLRARKSPPVLPGIDDKRRSSAGRERRINRDSRLNPRLVLQNTALSPKPIAPDDLKASVFPVLQIPPNDPTELDQGICPIEQEVSARVVHKEPSYFRENVIANPVTKVSIAQKEKTDLSIGREETIKTVSELKNESDLKKGIKKSVDENSSSGPQKDDSAFKSIDNSQIHEQLENGSNFPPSSDLASNDNSLHAEIDAGKQPTQVDNEVTESLNDASNDYNPNDSTVFPNGSTSPEPVVIVSVAEDYIPDEEVASSSSQDEPTTDCVRVFNSVPNDPDTTIDTDTIISVAPAHLDNTEGTETEPTSNAESTNTESISSTDTGPRGSSMHPCIPANEPVSAESAPNESAANESAPIESAPSESAPNESVSDESASNESAPNESVSDESAPNEPASNEFAPNEATYDSTPETVETALPQHDSDMPEKQNSVNQLEAIAEDEDDE